MPYRIEFTKQALEDIKSFRKTDQVSILDHIELHLGHDPTFQSKSRIKALRPGTFPPYRLRVGEFRIYYDVDEAEEVVIVFGVVLKSQSSDWLKQTSRRPAQRRIDMKVVPLNQVKNRFSAFLEMAKREDIVVTKNGHAAAVLHAVTDEDLEDYIFESDPRFIARIERLRRHYQRHGGIPIAKVRQRLGLARTVSRRRHSSR